VTRNNSCNGKNLPEDFSIKITAFGKDYKLETFQPLPISREKAFVFFENPKNLFDITPDWLDFRMDTYEAGEKVFKGAEYDYHIRWFGLRVKWRSKIQTYNPPHDFTDIQVVGPYTKWEHSHSFEERNGKTLMSDTVVYRVPLSLLGRIVHALFVKKQLLDIFCYRAIKIMEWVEGIKNENFIQDKSIWHLQH
jgi:ligand-binding SRPBCC domain-containing protein